jgi:two-component system sensor histidine kinase HydH
VSRARAVLLVDDNQALVENLREILEDSGYTVRQAASRAEALERARSGFDVALVDVRLPDGDGTELGARLREMVPDAQVIILTGFGTLESAAAAVRAGAWAYLVKPCPPPDLLMAIEQALRQVVVIEEKRELERRARVAEKLAAIGRLTAGLSHEIKNPLNAAALQLAVLERRIQRLPADARPTLEGPLQLVRDEVARLNHILEEFLQFARPRELSLRAVDVPALLGRVADLLEPQAAGVGVRLERAWRETPPLVGDEPRLQQAIVNLALNGIQATPPGGVVRIEAGPSGRGVEVAVEDSGPGIPVELRTRVFEPFFTTKEAGSGLGLPLVHSVIEQHGGTIAVEQAAIGGARFVLHLPAATTR